MTKLYHRNWIG